MAYATEHDDEDDAADEVAGSAAEAIRRGRVQRGGVLVQTNHWRSGAFQSVISWGGFFTLSAFVSLDGFAPAGASDAERVARIVLIVAPFLLVLGWWLFLRGRVGVVAGPDGLVARRALRRDVPLDPHELLEPASLTVWGRRSVLASAQGFLLPGSGRRGVPGLRSFSGPVTQHMACRLVTRPVRAWYLPVARGTTHADVVWRFPGTGRDVLEALGYDLPPEPESDRQPSKVGRIGETAGERLERWNRSAA